MEENQKEENKNEEIKKEEEIKQEENNTKEEKESNNSSEEIKKETEKTIKEVKETIKNTNLKKESKDAKDFLKDFFKNPIEGIKKSASESKNKVLKIAIMILLVWIIAIFVKDIIYIISNSLFRYFGGIEYFFKHLFSNLLDIIKDLVTPVISVGTLSGLVYVFKKNKNKSFLNIASTILVAKIPVVIASIVSLLTIIDTQITRITSLFSGFCGILSTVLLFFAIKELSDEKESENYFWKFALIIGIFYIVKLVFSYLGITL